MIRATRETSGRPHRAVPPLAALVGAASALILADVTSARAGGFELDGVSPAGTAMVGALTAVPGDASAVFHNPAGLAVQRGSGVVAGGSLLFATTRVTTSDGTVGEASLERRLSPSLFVSGRIGDRLVAGLGVYQQWGRGIDFPGASQGGANVPFPGRFVASRFDVGALTINPTLALRVTDRVAIGAGLDVLVGSLSLARAIVPGANGREATVELGGVADALSWNLGLLAEVVPGLLSLGLSWRAGADLGFDLRLRTPTPVDTTSAVADQVATTRLPLPHLVTVGLALRPVADVTVALDVRGALFSDLRELRVEFPAPPPGSRAPTVATTMAWHDTASVRLGVEWRATVGLALRLGLGWDPSPVPDATLSPLAPDGDRLLVGAGLAYALTGSEARGLGLSLAWQGSFAADRTSQSPDLPGAVWHHDAQVLSVAVTYRYGEATPRSAAAEEAATAGAQQRRAEELAAGAVDGADAVVTVGRTTGRGRPRRDADAAGRSRAHADAIRTDSNHLSPIRSLAGTNKCDPTLDGVEKLAARPMTE